jgi:hypothetical protein
MLIIAGFLGGLLMVGLVAAIIGALASSPRTTRGQASATLVLDIDSTARRELTHVLLDGVPQALPPRREYRVEPGQHRLELRRVGFVPISNMFTVSDGERHVVRLRWRPNEASDSSGTRPAETVKTNPAPLRKLPSLLRKLRKQAIIDTP